MWTTEAQFDYAYASKRRRGNPFHDKLHIPRFLSIPSSVLVLFNHAHSMVTSICMDNPLQKCHLCNLYHTLEIFSRRSPFNDLLSTKLVKRDVMVVFLRNVATGLIQTLWNRPDKCNSCFGWYFPFESHYQRWWNTLCLHTRFVIDLCVTYTFVTWQKGTLAYSLHRRNDRSIRA